MMDAAYEPDSMTLTHHYHHSLNPVQQHQHQHQHHQFDDYQVSNVNMLDENSIKYGISNNGANGASNGISSSQTSLNQTYGVVSVVPPALRSKRGSVQMYGMPFDPAPNICVDNSFINR